MKVVSRYCAGLAALLVVAQAFQHAVAQEADCDALAAAPTDDRRPAKIAGVANADLEGERAVAACQKAIEENPAEPRFKFQLARAHAKLGHRTEANTFARAAAEAGSLVAMRMLAGVLESDKNDAEALAWYRKAAEADDVRSMPSLGLMYETGKGTAKNIAEANKWYRRAAEAGNATGMVYLALNLEEGLGLTKDVVIAGSWFRKAAELGNAVGMRKYADALKEGIGAVQNKALAATWYDKAARANDHRAMVSLGEMFQTGDGVRKDRPEATYWFRKAADAGNGNAKGKLFIMGEEGYGPRKNQPYTSVEVFVRDARALGVAWAVRFPQLMETGCGGLEALRAANVHESSMKKLTEIDGADMGVVIARYTLRKNKKMTDQELSRAIASRICDPR